MFSCVDWRSAVGVTSTLHVTEIVVVCWCVGVGKINLNPLAAVIILLLTAYTLVGTKQSATLNLVITILSVLVILFVIVAGSINIDTTNWSDDFFPYGAAGVFKGAAVVFFAYLGFDAIANFSEEVKNPNRDLPIGIIGSLFLCSVLYIAVSLVITGMVSYQTIDVDAPLSVCNRSFAIFLVSVSALVCVCVSLRVCVCCCSWYSYHLFGV
jgi:basic amino acid/polyamine antiporter, APA family